MSENPYAAPTEYAHPRDQPPEVDRIRRSHLIAESNIKSIGVLYMLTGLLALAGGVSVILEPNPDISDSAEVFGFYLGTIGIPLGVLTLSVGLQKLNKAARIIAGILSVAGLALIPVGTAICALFLFVLFSKKGRFVPTARYQDIVAKTPHIKRKTSIVSWVLLAVIIIVFVLGFISLT
ncbi:hypothetical protein N9195_00060 [bacterium]|nr:hypothetical protein [bacterium]